MKLIKSTIFFIFIFTDSGNKIWSQVDPVVNCLPIKCIPNSDKSYLPDCKERLILQAEGKDDITPELDLIWEYRIDLNNDGIGKYNGFDYVVGGISRNHFKAGVTPPLSDNPYSENAKNPYDASGMYPLGNHKICWVAKDQDDKIGFCCIPFEVKDCTSPYINCIIVGSIEMPISGCITIGVSDLITNYYDNCSHKGNIKAYLDDNINKSEITVCCDELQSSGNGKVLNKQIKVNIEDETGNKNQCTASVTVKDELDVCPSDPGGQYGSICINPRDINCVIQASSYYLLENGIVIDSIKPFKKCFENVRKDKVYSVEPNRYDDPLNGVSTADIVKIQKHILGKEIFNDSYKLIAADVNLSCSITSADIAELRKLILGVITNFSKTKPWIYIPDKYRSSKFTKPCNLKPLDSIYFLNEDVINISFKEIKNGDVTNDSNPCFTSLTSRNKFNKEIYYKKAFNNNQHSVIYHFYLNEDFDLSGFQLSLSYDESNLKFKEILNSSCQLNKDNFFLQKNGILNISYDEVYDNHIKKGEELFSIKFELEKKDLSIDDVKLNYSSINPEVYDAYLNSYSLQLVPFDTNSSKFDINISRIEFNNITNELILHIFSNVSINSNLKAYNINGAEIASISDINLNQGINTININTNGINNSGIVFLSLSTNQIHLNYKFIIF